MNLFATTNVIAALNQQTPATNQQNSSLNAKTSTPFNQTLKTLTTSQEELDADTKVIQAQDQSSQVASMIQANLLIPTLLEQNPESIENKLQIPAIKELTTITKEAQTILQSLSGKAQNMQDFLSQLTKDELGKFLQTQQTPTQTGTDTNTTTTTTAKTEITDLKTAEQFVAQPQTVDAKEIFGEKLTLDNTKEIILPTLDTKLKTAVQTQTNVGTASTNQTTDEQIALTNNLVTTEAKKPLTKELEQNILSQQQVDLTKPNQTKPTLELQNQLTDLTKTPTQTIIQPKSSKDALSLLEETTKDEPTFTDKIHNILSDPKPTNIQKIVFEKEPVELNNLKQLVEQVVDQAKLTQKPGISEMVLRLKPNNLGEMTIRIIAGDGGAITASFHSNNPEARAILQQSLPAIKQELANTGLKVNDVGVYAGLGDFQSFTQQHHQTNQQNSPKINSAKQAMQDQELLEELQLAQGENVSPDGGVDYRI